MLRFALKHMATKRGKLALTAMSIVLSASVALLALNVSAQVRGGIVRTAGYYDMIVGPPGSATQLAMNTMFFTDAPLGTISYEVVERLEADPRVQEVVPFAMGDSFNGARIIGTAPKLLDGKELREGGMFEETFEAVVGSAVASRYGLNIGDEIVTSHGLAEHGAEHAANPLKVVGILKTTHTAYDNAVFTGVETVWAVHGHEGEEERGEEEEHGHGEREVCAVLVRTRGFNDYFRLMEDCASDASLIAINPATVLREVLENVDLSARIVYILSAIILVMNIFVVAVVAMLGLYDARREIALMRLIGVRMRTIARLFLLENFLVGALAAILSLVGSRLCIQVLSGFASSMGIVLNAGAVYPAEWGILFGVLALGVLPTAALSQRMARRDGLE